MRSSGLLLREIEQADAPIRARDAEGAIVVIDVARRRLECLRGELVRLGDGALRCDLHGRADDEQRSRAGAAEAGRTIGVAKAYVDAVGRHAEHVDGKLRERRGKTLAHRLCGGEDLDARRRLSP